MPETPMIKHDENNLRAKLRGLPAGEPLPDEILEAYTWMRGPMMGGAGEINNLMLMMICLKADQLKIDKRIDVQDEKIAFLQGLNRDAPEQATYEGEFWSKGCRVECSFDGRQHSGTVVLHESDGQVVRVAIDDDEKEYRLINVEDVREAVLAPVAA